MAHLDATGITRLVTDLKDRFATLTSGAVPIAQGGTGATTAAEAVENIVDGQDIEPRNIDAGGSISSDGSIGSDGLITGMDFNTKDGLHRLSEKANEAAVAKVESATATTATPEGGLFMLDGNLYRATTDIAVGATINSSNSVQTNMNTKIDGVWNSVMRLHGTTADTGASHDYDDYTTIGYWFVPLDSMTGNVPESGNSLGFLIVFAADTFKWQVFYNAFTAKVHHRHRNEAGTWSAWHEM